MLNAGNVRAVIDTNVLLSGLLWHGAPHALMRHVNNGTLDLVISPALLAEFAEVIVRPKAQQRFVMQMIDTALQASTTQAAE